MDRAAPGDDNANWTDGKERETTDVVSIETTPV